VVTGIGSAGLAKWARSMARVNNSGQADSAVPAVKLFLHMHRQSAKATQLGAHNGLFIGSRISADLERWAGRCLEHSVVFIRSVLHWQLRMYRAGPIGDFSLSSSYQHQVLVLHAQQCLQGPEGRVKMDCSMGRRQPSCNAATRGEVWPELASRASDALDFAEVSRLRQRAKSCETA